jgi:hypothetical protein
MPTFTYKSYNFIDKDPTIDYVRTVVEQSGLSYDQIETQSGVTAATLRKWFYGSTKKPQSATIQAVLRVCGHKLAIVPINYVEEIVPTPYHAPPGRDIMGRLAAKNKDPSWSSIYGRPTRTAPPEPETFRGKGKIVSRSIQVLPPIETGKK